MGAGRGTHGGLVAVHVGVLEGQHGRGEQGAARGADSRNGREWAGLAAGRGWGACRSRAGSGGQGALGLSSHNRTGGAAAKTYRKQEAAVGEAGSPSPAGGPNGGCGAVAAVAGRSGRRCACAGPGAQLPLQDRRPRPLSPGTRTARRGTRCTHAAPPPGATAPGTRAAPPGPPRGGWPDAGLSHSAGHRSGHAGCGHHVSSRPPQSPSATSFATTALASLRE